MAVAGIVALADFVSPNCRSFREPMASKEDWNRAGLVERDGQLINPNATRPVPQTSAAGPRTDRRAGATVEEAQDASKVSQLPHTEQEELEDADSEVAEREAAGEADVDNQAGDSGMEREGRASFRITVAFKVSNYGRRDPTGALETICDLIPVVFRRLRERIARRKLVGGISAPRPGGRRNNNRKAVAAAFSTTED